MYDGRRNERLLSEKITNQAKNAKVTVTSYLLRSVNRRAPKIFFSPPGSRTPRQAQVEEPEIPRKSRAKCESRS